MARSSCEKEHIKRGPWSREEDERLTRHIMFHGIGRSWRALPKAAGLSRCGKSCRLRWINYLQPGVKRGNFTPLEDRVIIDLHAQLGNKWSAIAGRLPGRTDNEIKNHWNTNLKRILLDDGIDPRTHKPLKGFWNPSTSTSTSTAVAAATTTTPNKGINSSSSSNTTRTPPTDSATSMSVVTTKNNSTTTTNAAPAPFVITTNKNKADKDKGIGFSSSSSEIQLFGTKMMKIGAQTSSAGENSSASAIIKSSVVTTTEEVQVEAHPELNLELSLALPSL